MAKRTRDEFESDEEDELSLVGSQYGGESDSRSHTMSKNNTQDVIEDEDEEDPDDNDDELPAAEFVVKTKPTIKKPTIKPSRATAAEKRKRAREIENNESLDFDQAAKDPSPSPQAVRKSAARPGASSVTKTIDAVVSKSTRGGSSQQPKSGAAKKTAANDKAGTKPRPVSEKESAGSSRTKTKAMIEKESAGSSKTKARPSTGKEPAGSLKTTKNTGKSGSAIGTESNIRSSAAGSRAMTPAVDSTMAPPKPRSRKGPTIVSSPEASNPLRTPSRREYHARMAAPSSRRLDPKSGLPAKKMVTIDGIEVPENASVTEREAYVRANTECRWAAFLWGFVPEELIEKHINLAWQQVLDIHSDDYAYARYTFKNQLKNIKSKMLKHTSDHVKEVIKARPEMAWSDDWTPDEYEEVAALWRENYNAGNFLKCYHYMDGYLDVEGSSALGQFYTQSCYATLCMTVSEEVAKPLDKNLREEILNLYDGLPDYEEFRQEGSVVERSDFKSTNTRFKVASANAKIRNQQIVKRRFVTAGAIPKKVVNESQDEIEDDANGLEDELDDGSD